ncbi:M14 family zinc carboxypeptidase [Alkalicoccus urumqiensis]|uniref:Gamma-D-glutamyl-meso-diaminopimelate peptidase n=1 Tax=Alkalicoccus urumqiensis TaxID=1548213 RepID=A0A2P6ML52_ALKUR|nr:M14 family zinc carboxypeptidase [Alkalicoccus urumqiensis]PRO67004.1 gamma-D-glutamyl-meso-diaminopimelate peptidase [Alkalicoccus urumqiensis]
MPVLRWLTLVLLLLLLVPAGVSAQSIVNPKQTYTYEQMERDLAALEARYPDIVQVQNIGTTAYGRNIYAVGLGKGLSTSYINGSNHAREWITTNLTMEMIDVYAEDYASSGGLNMKAILDHHTMWFVPMMNPDGVTLQQRGLSAFPSSAHASLIRMNGGSRDFTRWKANARGVDLNRQFDAGWYQIRNNPGSPAHENYPGTAPHTEKEVQAVVAFTEKIDPQMAVSYHSSGEILFWNYNQRGYQLSRDRQHASWISNATGYRLMGGHSSYSGGGYTDWFIDRFKRPAFTPEVSPYVGARHVPVSYFDRIWNQNRQVGKYIAQRSHDMYRNKLRASMRDGTLIINGTTYTADPGAVILDGRTYVPVRGVLEQLGASVGWDQESRTALIRSGSTEIALPLYQREAIVNGTARALDAPVQTLNGRTMVPLRFVSETIGARVTWEQATRTVRVIQ